MGVFGNEPTNLFVAELQGIDNRNLLYSCNLRNLRNLRLNPFSVFELLNSRFASGSEPVFEVESSIHTV